MPRAFGSFDNKFLRYYRMYDDSEESSSSRGVARLPSHTVPLHVKGRRGLLELREFMCTAGCGIRVSCKFQLCAYCRMSGDAGTPSATQFARYVALIDGRSVQAIRRERRQRNGTGKGKRGLCAPRRPKWELHISGAAIMIHALKDRQAERFASAPEWIKLIES